MNDKEKLVTISINSYARAELIKSRLEAEGIDCFLKNVNLIQSAISSGVKVRIRESDVEKATEILMSDRMAEETDKKLEINRKILVPVDFNVENMDVYKTVLNIAEKLSAEVQILHSYFTQYYDSIPLTDSYSTQVNLDILSKEKEVEARDKLNDFMEKFNLIRNETSSDHVSVTATLMQGEFSETVLEMAEEENVDLVVLTLPGGHEYSIGISETLNQEVVENAQCPVLILPEQTTLENPSLMKEVLYVTDFDETDFVNMKKLIRLINPANCRIHCLHVGKGEIESFTKARMNGFKDYFNSIYPDHSVVCSFIESGDRVKSINSYIEENDIETLAMTTHKRDIITRMFYPSTTKSILYHTKIPMLVYHA